MQRFDCSFLVRLWGSIFSSYMVATGREMVRKKGKSQGKLTIWRKVRENWKCSPADSIEGWMDYFGSPWSQRYTYMQWRRKICWKLVSLNDQVLKRGSKLRPVAGTTCWSEILFLFGQGSFVLIRQDTCSQEILKSHVCDNHVLWDSIMFLTLQRNEFSLMQSTTQIIFNCRILWWLGSWYAKWINSRQ